jgi:hypothetical protein
MTHRSRRDWLRLSAAGVVGYSMSGWFEALASEAAGNPQRRRACILLWMNGGPSQMDTFDLKPGHANGGPYKEIATSVPGIKISEHLLRIAKHADKLAIIRSMSTREGDHARATFLGKTGYLPQGPIQYPPFGAFISKELERAGADLPGFVSIAPNRNLTPSALGPGFLGPRHAPLVVGENAGNGPDGYDTTGPERALVVRDLHPPADVEGARGDSRIRLLRGLQDDFLPRHADAPPLAHQAALERAVRLMQPAAARAFRLDEEPAAVRDAYGRTLFGQGCLLARRLVERGVPFVEVTLGTSADGTSGWDTHADNFDAVRRLSQVLDPAWAALMDDLKDRGLLDTTLVVWMGEFGRTPKINQLRGRDHYPAAWTTVLAGGGIKGGQVVGKTSADGSAVEERPVSVPDFLATICHALGIDPGGSNLSNIGRPIARVDRGARPIGEVLA